MSEPASAGGGVRGGLFVAFEGGDSAGKSTQIESLAAWLDQAGHPVVRTREPGGTELGRSLREALLHGGEVDARAEALLYAGDRAQHVATVVRPALERGEIVLGDRYIDSSIAYQGVGRELGAEWIEAISRWATGGLRPDLTILLDVDVDAAADRRRGRNDRLEGAGEEFHRRIRSAFRALAARDPERYLVIDGTRHREEIARLIRHRVAALLESRDGAPAGPDPVGLGAGAGAELDGRAT